MNNLYLHLSVFLFLWVVVCMCPFLYVFIGGVHATTSCMWRSEDNLGCWASLFASFERGPFVVSCYAYQVSWYVIFQDPPIFTFHAVVGTRKSHAFLSIQLYVGSRDLNSGPHTHTASTVPSYPFHRRN